MPGRTPPEAVLAAAREFARLNFALQYRYAMVLHTDQAHPHVHLIVKAEHEHEPGRRLTIRKETLRQWREDFAACLRREGVVANATPAVVRGRPRTSKKDPIHQRLRSLAQYEALPAHAKARMAPPVGSTFMRAKVQAVADEIKLGQLTPEAGIERLQATRQAVVADWQATAAALEKQGEAALAREVRAFVDGLAPARTEKMMIAATLLARIRAARQRDAPTLDDRDVGPER